MGLLTCWNKLSCFTPNSFSFFARSSEQTSSSSFIPSSKHTGRIPQGQSCGLRMVVNTYRTRERHHDQRMCCVSKGLEVVPRDGIEPPTRGFSLLCSTN